MIREETNLNKACMGSPSCEKERREQRGKEREGRQSKRAAVLVADVDGGWPALSS